MNYCSCGHRVYSKKAGVVRCGHCGNDVECPGDGEHPRKVKWPAWAIALSKLRTDADAGVGDTFERHAAMVGGRVFKKLSKQLGLPCGCDARQADWNRLYPYPQ